MVGAQWVADGGCDGVGEPQSFFPPPTVHSALAKAFAMCASLLAQRSKHLVFSREAPDFLQGSSA